MNQDGGRAEATVHVVQLNSRDLLDYRAIQRTFDGAYFRTALGQLCYATVILRLFQDKFFYVGLVYAILGVGFVPVAVIRYRMAASNVDRYIELQRQHNSSAKANSGPSGVLAGSSSAQIETVGASTQSDTVLRRTFVTAGSVVAAATSFVVFVEVALLILILRV